MKRASFQSRTLITALIAALLSSVAPAAGASVSKARRQHDLKAAQVTLAQTASVKVTAGPTGVLIEWRTSFELDNLGFNVYRQRTGTRSLINPSIIAGSALLVGQGTPLYAGYTYQWFDAAGGLDSIYYLENLDLKGTHTITGPFTPVWNESLPKAQQASTVSGVAAQNLFAGQTGGPTGVFGAPATTPADIQAQWAIAGQPGLKIGVKQDGWYHVTQPEMAAAGFDVSLDSANLRLFVDGVEVPCEVSRVTGMMGPNDFLEFYGTGLDTPTTDTHVYYLINGSQAGLRVPLSGSIHTEDGPTPTPPPVVAPTATPLPVPISSPTVGASEISSGGVWFGTISAGVSGEKENSSAQPVVAERSEAVAVRQDGREISLLPPAEREAQTATALPPDLSKRESALRTGTVDKAASPASVMNAAQPAAKSKLTARRKGRHRRTIRHRGRRINKQKRNHALAAVASSTAGFLYDTQLKERFTYFSALLNGSAENFFGGPLLTPPTRTLKVSGLQTDSQGTALLRIGLQGTSNQAHLVNVLINEVMVGSLSYSFQDFAEQTFNVAVSQLHEGDNVIRFVVAGGSGDFSLFSYARLTYPRMYHAENDTLGFTLRSSQSATIDGFTTPNIRVLDISNPTSIQEVRPVVQPAGPGYLATVTASGGSAKGSRTLLALPSNSFLHPASLLFNQPSSLNQPSASNATNAADLLIISHKSFIALPNLATLVAQRRAQGLIVKVVDIEDIYDEFSYGMHTSQAITDFLVHARTNWTVAPTYLLLVGSATYDPRNYVSGAKVDLVPTKRVDTVFLETGSDDALTDFDNDGVPEIPVGRLPVKTQAEANLVLSKIINFSPGNVPQKAVMVADTQGSYFFNFEQADEDLIPLLTPGMQANVQRIYRNQPPADDNTTRTNIINAINSGAALVNYSGHGNVDVWTGAPIFSTSDALALTNGNKLPLVMVMDCLNGYFIAPNLDCVSESLLKAPNGGAVASFSSSGLTIPIGQHEMGQKLFQLLYSGPPMALGDATRQAKLATTDLDVRRSWILFGDPTMKIR